MEARELAVENFLSNCTKTLSDELGVFGRKQKADIPTVTISMQPGSGGYLIAQRLADRLGFSFYDRKLLTGMALCNDVKPNVLETVEKHRLKGISDFISLLIQRRHVHPEQYLRYLKEFATIVGNVGHAVIVGRGINFVLPKEQRFAVRIIAPLETRIKNVAFAHGVTMKEAKKRITNRAARRKEFVRRSFHTDIENPEHYDLIINTCRLDIESAVDTIMGTIVGSQFEHPFNKSEAFILRKAN